MFDALDTTLARLRALSEKAAFLGPTLARLTVGLVFIGTGWGKLHSLPDVTDYFASLHIPAPGLNARLAAGTEFFGGVLVLLGLGTRLVTLPMAFTMVVAILSAKRGDVDGLTSLVGLEEWSYIVFFLWLAVAGAGPLSLDRLLGRWRGRRAEPVALPKPLLRPQV
ncbi:MAG TPA: DoxX family protein [Polyangia bacterium]|nr:DoxX family protein [Polyangia bacterium]